MRKAGAAALLVLLPVLAQARPESWAAVLSTGGISVGAPFHANGGWLLGVRARLSKLDPGEKGAPRGGPSCSRTEAVVEGSDIYLTIVSGAARGPAAAVCPAARLGEIDAGTYKVYYRGPDGPATLLKEIELPR